MAKNEKVFSFSHTGSRTRAAWVKARNPNRQTIWDTIKTLSNFRCCPLTSDETFDFFLDQLCYLLAQSFGCKFINSEQKITIIAQQTWNTFLSMIKLKFYRLEEQTIPQPNEYHQFIQSPYRLSITNSQAFHLVKL